MPKTVIGEDDEPAKRPAQPAALPVTASSKRAKADGSEATGSDGSEAKVADEGTAAGGAAPEGAAVPDAEVNDDGAAPVNAAEADDAAPEEVAPAPPPWSGLTVAIIDDAIHVPRLDRLSERDAAAVSALLTTNVEVMAELAALGCAGDAAVDTRLQALAESDGPLVSLAALGASSPDAVRMVEEHRAFRRLRDILEGEVQNVTVCDPFVPLPDLSAHNLILLDYYLEGPAGGRTLSVEVATVIRQQLGRAPDQQIVLMSSLETVRDARGEFRSDTDLAGSAFAFVGKPDLNEPWKVKAHLGMLERARPYAPAFIDYRTGLDAALVSARDDLLRLVDDLDIGDYAFLQSRALMKDGHPLGDYVFWLLSSQLMALAFERDEMRKRQRVLDSLEFVGAPFAATEPSTVVANMLHSALVSRNMGPLGPHPRAKADTPYAGFPLVQLGDVFLDADRTKAVVVMSADCDLAFSPMAEREPDAETPVMLVPGKPVKMKDAKDELDPNTEGLLHREEVYRIVWDFAKYRAVPLGGLEAWLKAQKFDVTNRDRLRPLFGLKLQQEFGAHLMRVGPPILPPTTTGAVGRIYLSSAERELLGDFTPSELMVTRVKGVLWLRVTTRIASALRDQCETLRSGMLDEQAAATTARKKADWQKKLDALAKDLDDDAFWIKLLEGFELNAPGSMKVVGPLGFVVGAEWTDNKMRVVLEITEEAPPRRRRGTPPPGSPLDAPADMGAGSVSAAA
jgi:hypothetical protein